MDTTKKEVLQFIRENDVKFIRLAFCDLFGRQKNISIMQSEMETAFSDGISFDASAVSGFSDVTKSDLFLVPDPSTLAVLPWRPQQGRVARFFCDIKHPDGSVFECDTRNILKRTIQICGNAGYDCKIGAECEFYLFKTDINGDPTTIPLDNGSYLDVSPLDKGENIRREICINLEDLGISPECSHHEQGPGQNEIDFKFSDPLSSADNIMSLKTTVKVIAARNGVYGSFMPKPLKNMPGSGMHVNISLSKNGLNIFGGEQAEQAAIVKSFIAGILERIPEITLFLNPTANSYERFGAYEAPKYVSWSSQNRSQLVRIPAATGEKMRMELRSPDPSANPYLAFALILRAGFDGIERGLGLCEPVNKNLYAADGDTAGKLTKLPDTMEKAFRAASCSEFAKSVVGEAVFYKYMEYKKRELSAFCAAADKEAFCMEQYFQLM